MPVFSLQIVGDHTEEMDEKYKLEEEDLHHQLTKLSNKATVAQLNDMVSESETDGEAMSPRNHDTSISDLESHSEMSELSIVTKPMEVDSSAPLSPLTPMSDTQKSPDSGIKVSVSDSHPPSITSDKENNNNNVIEVGKGEQDMDRLWERVENRGESPHIENAWKTVEAKRSQFKSNDSDATMIHPSVDNTLITSVLVETELEVFHEVSWAFPIHLSKKHNS